MPRKTLADKEKERVLEAFLHIVNKFKLDVNLIILPMPSKKTKAKVNNLFTIERSGRETADKSTFLIYFNPKKVKLMERRELLRHSWHELLHAMTWGYIDEYNEVIKYISNPTLFKELTKREEEVRENITYALERKLGPFCLPEAAWDIED